MASVLERGNMRKIQVDRWTTREQLCLASSVLRSGDQNWMSVSRSLRLFGEPNRPADWFSQKNCAVQYAMLLENVETPKRKKRTEKGEVHVETPGESIVRRLTHERIEELKCQMQEKRAAYLTFKEEGVQVKMGHADDRLADMLREIEAETKRNGRGAETHEQCIRERDEKKLEMERNWRQGTAQSPLQCRRGGLLRSISVRRHRSQSEPSSETDSPINDTLNIDVVGDETAIDVKPPVAPVPTSPLLTSLLKSPSPAPTSQAASLLQQAISQRGSSPTISSLLSTAPGIPTTVSSSLKNLVTSALSGTVAEHHPHTTPSPSAGAPTLSMLLELPPSVPGKPLPELPTSVCSKPPVPLSGTTAEGSDLCHLQHEEMRLESDIGNDGHVEVEAIEAKEESLDHIITVEQKGEAIEEELIEEIVVNDAVLDTVIDANSTEVVPEAVAPDAVVPEAIVTKDTVDTAIREGSEVKEEGDFGTNLPGHLTQVIVNPDQDLQSTSQKSVPLHVKEERNGVTESFDKVEVTSTEGEIVLDKDFEMIIEGAVQELNEEGEHKTGSSNITEVVEFDQGSREKGVMASDLANMEVIILGKLNDEMVHLGEVVIGKEEIAEEKMHPETRIDITLQKGSEVEISRDDADAVNSLKEFKHDWISQTVNDDNGSRDSTNVINSNNTEHTMIYIQDTATKPKDKVIKEVCLENEMLEVNRKEEYQNADESVVSEHLSATVNVYVGVEKEISTKDSEMIEPTEDMLAVPDEKMQGSVASTEENSDEGKGDISSKIIEVIKSIGNESQAKSVKSDKIDRSMEGIEEEPITSSDDASEKLEAKTQAETSKENPNESSNVSSSLDKDHCHANLSKREALATKDIKNDIKEHKKEISNKEKSLEENVTKEFIDKESNKKESNIYEETVHCDDRINSCELSQKNPKKYSLNECEKNTCVHSEREVLKQDDCDRKEQTKKEVGKRELRERERKESDRDNAESNSKRDIPKKPIDDAKKKREQEKKDKSAASEKEIPKKVSNDMVPKREQEKKDNSIDTDSEIPKKVNKDTLSKRDSSLKRKEDSSNDQRDDAKKRAVTAENERTTFDDTLRRTDIRRSEKIGKTESKKETKRIEEQIGVKHVAETASESMMKIEHLQPVEATEIKVEVKKQDTDLKKLDNSNNKKEVDKAIKDSNKQIQEITKQERPQTPSTEEEKTSDVEGVRPVVKKKLTATALDSVPNSPISNTEDEREYKAWKKAIMLVYGRLATHKYASLFLRPITDDQAPGYSSIVHRPMDLLIIKKNIETGMIRTTAEFQRDVMLMFQNSVMYNKSSHFVHKMARQMQQEGMQHIQDFLTTQMLVQVVGEVPLRRETRTTEANKNRDVVATPEVEDGGKRKRLSAVDNERLKKRKMEEVRN